MLVIHSIPELTAAISEQKDLGKRIGFVPTMGNLHDGHISLVAKAQQHSDFVVASIFVNPMQFGANEDLDKYPRTLEADSRKLEAVACDLLFAPSPNEIYPNGLDKHLKMNMPHMASVLCGKSRPTHFEGVCTVVTKLFNLVRPDAAVFGKKDLQQLLIIKQMTKDLCLPINILSGDTVREESGLAMSSRNSLLSAEEKAQASVINKVLDDCSEKIKSGENRYGRLMENARQQIDETGFRTDYFDIRKIEDLELAKDGEQYENLAIFAAAFAEKTRLIDNITLKPVSE